MATGVLNVEAFLRSLIRSGSIEVVMPAGARLVLGDGTGPPVTVRITDRLTLARIAAAPYLGLGEAYMDGRLVFERGTIRNLLEIGSRNAAAAPRGPQPGAFKRWWKALRDDRISRAAARRNVAHHYDLSLDL